MTQSAHGHRFDREKFAAATCETFLKWRSDDQVSGDFSNYERIALLRRHFFADIDALEKTGAVARAIAFAVSGDNRKNPAPAPQ